jgi:hypothetical protein
MNDADDVDDALKPAGISAPTKLQERLRELTSRRVRRRSDLRRLAIAAALVACYAAGAATVWLTRPAPQPVVVVEHVPAEPAQPAPAAPPSAIPQSPRELEIAAERADGAESARLYVEAGRRYGNDWNDWQSALRCYRNALDLASETPVIDQKNDDWLLVKLKTDRRESHANP